MKPFSAPRRLSLKLLFFCPGRRSAQRESASFGAVGEEGQGSCEVALVSHCFIIHEVSPVPGRACVQARTHPTVRAPCESPDGGVANTERSRICQLSLRFGFNLLAVAGSSFIFFSCGIAGDRESKGGR